MPLGWDSNASIGVGNPPTLYATSAYKSLIIHISSLLYIANIHVQMEQQLTRASDRISELEVGSQ